MGLIFAGFALIMGGGMGSVWGYLALSIQVCPGVLSRIGGAFTGHTESLLRIPNTSICVADRPWAVPTIIVGACLFVAGSLVLRFAVRSRFDYRSSTGYRNESRGAAGEAAASRDDQ